MPRNAGAKTMAAEEVFAIMAAAVEVVCGRLPGERRETVERTVYDVTAELVSTITDPARLATMLRLRATARLTAATGELTPIRTSRGRWADPSPASAG
jgi:hypothetical protein